MKGLLYRYISITNFSFNSAVALVLYNNSFCSHMHSNDSIHVSKACLSINLQPNFRNWPNMIAFIHLTLLTSERTIALCVLLRFRCVFETLHYHEVLYLKTFSDVQLWVCGVEKNCFWMSERASSSWNLNRLIFVHLRAFTVRWYFRCDHLFRDQYFMTWFLKQQALGSTGISQQNP